jgi:hypothetical protein
VKPGAIATPIFGKAQKESKPLIDEDADSPYAWLVRNVDSTLDAVQTRAISPYFTSLPIAHAVTSPFPQTKYYVGADAVLLGIFRPLMHDWVWDWLFESILSIQNRLILGQKANVETHKIKKIK